MLSKHHSNQIKVPQVHPKVWHRHIVENKYNSNYSSEIKKNNFSF